MVSHHFHGWLWFLRLNWNWWFVSSKQQTFNCSLWQISVNFTSKFCKWRIVPIEKLVAQNWLFRHCHKFSNPWNKMKSRMTFPNKYLAFQTTIMMFSPFSQKISRSGLPITSEVCTRGSLFFPFSVSHQNEQISNVHGIKTEFCFCHAAPLKYPWRGCWRCSSSIRSPCKAHEAHTNDFK